MKKLGKRQEASNRCSLKHTYIMLRMPLFHLQRGFRDDSPETVMREEARRRLRQSLRDRSPYTTVTGAEKIR